MTGRLQTTFRGRPVEIEFASREVLVKLPSWSAAWGLRRIVTVGTLPVLRALRDQGLSLNVLVGSRSAISVLPDPPFTLRLLVPLLRFLRIEE